MIRSVTLAEELLLEIARCPAANTCFSAGAGSHPCSKVVLAQGTGRDAFHVPEPWSGDIERTPILFVSWNPSWNPDERFPTDAWADGEIVEFFRRRFEHTEQDSHTWREIRGIASHLLGRDVVAGVDYTVTDVVHCKSWQGKGAREALEECAGRYLKRVLSLAGARVVVGLGRDARQALASRFGVPAAIGLHEVADGGETRLALVLLGAPGSSQPRRLRASELERARLFLNFL